RAHGPRRLPRDVRSVRRDRVGAALRRVHALLPRTLARSVRRMNELTTLLEAAVRRDPDGAALLHPGGSVTYAELGTMARTVADDAAARGVAPGQLVAIGMANSPALVAALFGIWMAGGVVLELPPALAP